MGCIADAPSRLGVAGSRVGGKKSRSCFRWGRLQCVGRECVCNRCVRGGPGIGGVRVECVSDSVGRGGDKKDGEAVIRRSGGQAVFQDITAVTTPKVIDRVVLVPVSFGER